MIPKAIILHHSLTKDSGTVSWGAIRRYHMSYAYEGNIISKQDADELIIKGYPVKLPWDDIGYHFGVEFVLDQYEILMGRMPNIPGAHTVGFNNKSLGICMVGNFDVTEPPKGIWDTTLKLCHYLTEAFSISPSAVYGHRDWANKSCPGKLFDLNKFRDDLIRL